MSITLLKIIVIGVDVIIFNTRSTFVSEELVYSKNRPIRCEHYVIFELKLFMRNRRHISRIISSIYLISSCLQSKMLCTEIVTRTLKVSLLLLCIGL